MSLFTPGDAARLRESGIDAHKAINTLRAQKAQTQAGRENVDGYPVGNVDPAQRGRDE